MSQATAGETITLTIDGQPIIVKVEDASKSESIQAKVVASESEQYVVDHIYEFNRTLLK